MVSRYLALVICIFLLAACGSAYTAYNNSGNSRYSDQEYQAALRAYQQAQVSEPDQPAAYYNAASAYAGIQEMNAAVAALEQALETSDKDLSVDAYYNLGNVHYQMGQYDLAIQAYQQALLLDPNDEDARYNLEIALLRYIPPTPTAQEQQTEPELGESDPTVTPTNQPGGFDGPTPTPPPVELDLSATPDAGQGEGGDENSSTPVPRTQGRLTIEQAERLLEQIRQDQQSLREYLQQPAASGQTSERDW